MMFAPDRDTLEAAQKIQADAARSFNLYKSRKDLNQQGVQQRMAKVWVNAKARLDALEATALAEAKARQQALTTRVFGIDDLAGSNPVDRSAVSVSYRDAQARAAEVKSPAEANRMLQQAANTGDDLLARAVAAHAYEQASSPLGRMSEWPGVLDTYTSSRPASAEAISSLKEMAAQRINASNIFAFQLPTPSELSRMQPYQIEQLASTDNE